MAKHGKTSPSRVRWQPAVLVFGVALLLLSACLIATYSGALDAVASVFAGDVSTAPQNTTNPTTTTTTAPPPPAQYAVPEEMKGVWLSAGVDYLTEKTPSASKVKQQIDAAFSALDGWDFNTLLLPLFKETQAVYPSQIADAVLLSQADGTVFDPIAYILEKAKEHKLFVYGVIDLQVRTGGEWDPRTESGQERVVKTVREIATRYQTDGFFLSGFTFSGKQVAEGEESAAKEALNQLMSAVTGAITQTNRNYYVGLLSTGVWAHKSVDERGSKTAEYYEEYTDGCADTLSWVKQGLFQCVMAQIDTSTSHPTASFQNILEWWSGVAETQKLPLYVSHAADEAGSYRTGWKSTDQLAQQYLYCKASAAWQGSAYRSLSALTTDKTGIAEALKRAYAGTLDEEYIYKQLTLTFPTKTQYTTKESSLVFQGGGDTNFPLTMNGKTVELSEHGFFSVNVPLSVGKNTFTFSHKGTTKTYTITYQKTLLEEVSPNQDMQVEGGNVFIIRAVARKGSTVTATIGGSKITLTATATKEDDSGNILTDFQTFEGKYTLPSGKIGSAVNLGIIKVTASLNGLTETKNGGSISLKALPTPTTTTGTSPSGGAPAPLLPEGNREVVKITSDFAETFSGGGLVDDYSRPYNSYLPKGTCDYLAGKVYNGKYSYYLLASGKRVYMKDATVIQATLPQTTLQNGAVEITGTHTVLRFDTDWNIPVYVAAKEQQYYFESTKGVPNYGIENYSQTATYVNIEFHHLSAVPPLPDISQSPLFTGAKWITGSQEGVYILRLDLKKKGGFYGFMPRWNGKTLSISFLNPANISQNTAAERLKGVRILLDPGHGSPDDKPWEAPFNLAYANVLKEKLEALGATVDMTRTTPLTTNLSLQSRVQHSQRNDYHMVISVHMNGFDGTATGATVHYYTEQSYTPSAIIYNKMHAVEVPYGVGVGTGARSKGTWWDTLYMTRSIFHCPSILLECAFLDNKTDKEALANPVYRDKLMQAVTDGVVEYFNGMQ